MLFVPNDRQQQVTKVLLFRLWEVLEVASPRPFLPGRKIISYQKSKLYEGITTGGPLHEADLPSLSAPPGFYSPEFADT